MNISSAALPPGVRDSQDLSENSEGEDEIFDNDDSSQLASDFEDSEVQDDEAEPERMFELEYGVDNAIQIALEIDQAE